ncbi:MAG: beta-ketoacyl-ACP synthase II [SAR324 cluster bacterium]|nr:beta-ketoacyl-ACP synthase II [SAR324 cluster bacterium]
MRRRVVVTGLGIVSPIGNNVKTAWEACCNGQSGTDRITKFDASGLRSQIAGEVLNFEMPSIIPSKEVKKMDTFIHYAVSAAQEGLEDARLEITDEIADEVGVSMGVGIGGQPMIEKYHMILEEKGAHKISPFFIPMVLLNMASGQISLLFGTRNYNSSTVSACASSNHSIGDAARVIERGDAKVIIAGGAEAALTPLCVGGFAAMRALSTRNDEPKRASRPYDRDRDGFVFAEGAGVLILEEYEFAKERGADIYCELGGYGFSSDAHHITAPSVEGPARAIKMAIKDAHVNPEDVDHINAHATSTPAGDINELQAIKSVLGEHAKNIAISGTKSMTGHLLGAAGAVESALTIKALKHGFVPPTINIDNLDPECDLDVTPNVGKERSIKVAMSNSFGFGGTNASLLFKAIE